MCLHKVEPEWCKFRVIFVATKSRVAPLNQLSIPGLELQAAVIGSRLGSFTLDESRLIFERVRYWTDSRVALAWIQSESRSYKPFVSCRVGEILVQYEALRLAALPNITERRRWLYQWRKWKGGGFNGPDFLPLEEQLWPVEDRKADLKEVNNSPCIYRTMESMPLSCHMIIGY